MIREISDDELEELMESTRGLSASEIWLHICLHVPEISLASYDERKWYFLSVMYRLMKDGALKIADKDQLWEGTPEEQVQRYLQRWPEDESLLDESDFEFNPPPDWEAWRQYWAEGRFVWFYEDGDVDWT